MSSSQLAQLKSVYLSHLNRSRKPLERIDQLGLKEAVRSVPDALEYLENVNILDAVEPSGLRNCWHERNALSYQPSQQSIKSAGRGGSQNKRISRSGNPKKRRHDRFESVDLN